ncbi:MAG: hypothetical protein JRI25_05710 [Deltaproteobacteria bacterium]|nr:hypothetical protein [Deltaproteobacteria bacterium]
MMRNVFWVTFGLLLVGCNNENQLVGDEEPDALFTMDNPAPAAYLRQGMVDVSGLAEGLREVTVDGVAATIAEDGTWATEVAMARGVNIVEGRGVDTLGNALYLRHGVLAGDFADPSNPVEDAMAVRVNEGGLEEIFDLVGDMITDDALAPTIAAANPVYENAFSLGGFDAATIEASITGLYFDRLSIYADPQLDKMFVEVWIPNLFVSLNASGEIIVWPYSEDAYIWADRVEIGGDITLDAAEGHLVVDFSNSTVSLVGFGYDTSLIPSDIESWLFIDAVTLLLEDMLSDLIDEQLPALLEEQLSTLDISFETELMGRNLTVSADFSDASIDEKGVAIGMNLDIDIPGQTSHPYAGYLSANGAAPHVDQSSDLAVALSDDLLNKVLFEAWQSGLLAMALSTDDGSLDPLMLAPLHADQGTITIDAKLPPVIVESNNGLHAQMAELEITIETPGGEMGEYITLAVAAFIDVELRVTDSVLKLDLGTPDLQLVVRDSDWGASNEATTALLEEMLPVDLLTSLLGEIEFPIPSLGGLVIDHATVQRDSSGVHTGVRVSLH